MDFATDLTLEEKDLIAMIRRLEGRYGKDDTQLVVFRGDEERAHQVSNVVLAMKECDEAEYEGEIMYLIVKVAEDPVLRQGILQNVHDLVDATFNAVFDEETPTEEDS